jgi:integrase
MTDQSTACESAAKGVPRLLDRVGARIREKYYSRRTGEAYEHWIRRFILFHDRTHPREMGEAILFLYKEVLGLELGRLDGLVRASRPPRLPSVLTRAEVERLRVKDVDLSYRQTLVRDGKGENDRVTMLLGKLVEPPRAHLGRVRLLHARKLREGYAR